MRKVTEMDQLVLEQMLKKPQGLLTKSLSSDCTQERDVYLWNLEKFAF